MGGVSIISGSSQERRVPFLLVEFSIFIISVFLISVLLISALRAYPVLIQSHTA